MRFNAWLGLAFAVSLTLIETVHNWGDWSEPAFWIIDYIACLLLAGGSGLVLFKRQERGVALLGVGWGFSCAMFWMAYFQIRRDYALMPETADPLVLNVCLALFITTIVGLTASLFQLLRTSDRT
jgi:drug/metabolite transporter (DMT)-like permease